MSGGNVGTGTFWERLPCSPERWACSLFYRQMAPLFPLERVMSGEDAGKSSCYKACGGGAPRRQSGGMGLGDAAELLLQQT